MFWAEIWKILEFLSENFPFFGCKIFNIFTQLAQSIVTAQTLYNGLLTDDHPELLQEIYCELYLYVLFPFSVDNN